MNAGLAHAIESLFGPSSELVDIASFIQAAVEAESRVISSNESLNPNERALDSDVELDCSVSDIRDSLYQTWDNPMFSAYLLRDHEYKIAALHGTPKPAKPKRKPNLPDPDSLSPEVTILQKQLDNVRLSSWKLQMDSVLFMRSSKNSDQNVLAQVKNTSNSHIPGLTSPYAIITFSVHNKVTWGAGYAMRASQHAVSSSHTLEDVFKVIPCTSNDSEKIGVGNGGMNQCSRTDDCVICIEGVVYGYRERGDYIEKLLTHLETISKQQFTITKGATAIHDTPIATLSLRINQPYWLFHQGNCEHFIVVDEIRFQHPLDATVGYPLTLQITPPLLDLCRICAKVPAVLSIIGDVRLGESPCLTCDPCWRVMGDPGMDSGVLVKSLP